MREAQGPGELREAAGAPELLSVVIPTYNEAACLPVLLDCLEAQRWRGFSVLLADNRSTDGTPELARARGHTVVAGGLPGPARNRGAEAARGEWILFLDADVEIGPEFVGEALAAVRRRKADLASFSFRPATGGFLVRLIHSFSNWYFRLTSLLGFPHGIGGALLVRREVHQEVGGFDEGVRVAEDQDYIVRIARRYRYRCLLRPRVTLSVRRFADEGPLRLSFRWVFIELHRLFRGELTTDRVRYFEETEREGPRGRATGPGVDSRAEPAEPVE